MKYVYCILLLVSLVIYSASAFAINGRTTYQAKIYKPDGQPLESVSVNFRFTVLDPSSSCVLYVEDYAAVNMIGSGGLTSFSLGMGTRTYPASGPTTFAGVFDNSTSSFVCQTPGVFNPVPTDNRKIVMQFNEGLGWQTLPAMAINSVPYAMYSAKAQNSSLLNGKADTLFVEVSTLASLNCQSNEAIKFNGATFSCIPVGVSSSGISSVTTSGTVLITGGTVSAPVISITAATMSSDGYLTSLDYAEFKAKLSASSTQIVSTLGYAPVSGAAVNTQIQASQLNGDVSGTIAANIVQSVGGKTSAQVATSVNDTLAATSSATADTIVKRNSSGNFTANDVYASATKVNYVDIYKPSTSFNIRLQAPTSLAANYTLNLPTSSGTVGQVLSTDGSGNLSWISAATGSVTSVSATAPLVSTGGSMPSISITQSTSSTNGYLSSTDWNTFNNKQQATSAAIIATLGYTPAASGSFTSSQWTTSGSTINYATGNVGVGVAAPAYKLDVNGAIRATAASIYSAGPNIEIRDSDNTNAQVARTGFIYFSDSTGTQSGYVGDGLGTTNALTLTTTIAEPIIFATNSVDRMTIDSTGRVGIGTSTPAVVLQANGEFAAGSSVVIQGNTSNKRFLIGDTNSYLNAGGGSNKAYIFGDSNIFDTGGNGSRQAFIFGRGNVVSSGASADTIVIGQGITTNVGNKIAMGIGSEAMTILSTGHVGLGVTAPTARLHLTSGTTAAGTAPLKFTSGTLMTAAQAGSMEFDGFSFYLTDGAGNRRAIATGTNSNTIDDANYINSAGNITMTPVGSVVVSSTTASTNSSTGALIVNGGAGVAGNLNVAGTISGSATIKGTGFRANQGAPDAADSSTVGYAFGVDGDTGLFSPGSGAANGVLAFYSNNAEKMRMTSTGFGIGTSSPATSLDVVNTGYKQLRLKGSSSSSQELWAGSVANSVGSYIGNNAYYDVSYQFIPNYTAASGLNFRQDGSTEFWNDTGLTSGTSYVPTKRMVITNAGNVGVATTAPRQLIDVAPGTGNAVMRATTVNAAAALQLYKNTAGAYKGYALTTDGNTLSFNYDSVENSGATLMSLTASGNLGVGVPSPGEKLDVLGNMRVGSSDSNYIAFRGTTGDGAGSYNHTYIGERVHAAGESSELLLFKGNDSDNASGPDRIRMAAGNIVFDTYASPDAPSGAFEAVATSPLISTKMIIKGNGAVGMGTTSPAEELSIFSNVDGDATINVMNPNAGASARAGVTLTNSGTAYGSYSGGLLLGGKTHATMTDRLYFFANSGVASGIDIVVSGPSAPVTISTGGGPVERFRVDQSGNVGIGTSAPTARLQVVGGDISVPANSVRFDAGTTAGTAGIASSDSGSIFGEHDLATETSRLVIEIYDNINDQIVLRTNAPSGGTNVDMMKVQYNQVALAPTSGNVGVGLETPTSKLHVNGGIRQPNYGQIVAVWDGTTRTNNIPAFLTQAYMEAHQDETYTWRGVGPRLKDTAGCNGGPTPNYFFDGFDTTWNGTYRMTIGKLSGATYIVEIEWNGWGTNLKDAASATINTGSNQGNVHATLSFDGTTWVMQHMQGQVGTTPFSCH